MTKHPIAVLSSDVHYNLQTLKLADAAMRMAIAKANSLGVPLIVAGDLHDTKANLRGECVNAMMETFKRTKLQTYILRGNHDALNEKSKDHSLSFLDGICTIIVKPGKYSIETDDDSNQKLSYLIPYEHDIKVLRAYLKTLPEGSQLIMHQGLQKANSGDYFQDHSALTPDDVAGMRVISGHYHTRQAIKLPNGGVWNFIGNPYTLTWGEAQDPPKGFQVLYNDGSLEFVPTNLRKHVIVDIDAMADNSSAWSSNGKTIEKDDLVWVKVRGRFNTLAAWNRAKVKEITGLETFKLDLIPLISETIIQPTEMKGIELLDSLIDSLTNTTDDRKARLKELARNIGT